MIRDHMRSNIVGYVALFVAMGGTAAALPTTRVFTDDIVNGQVRTTDISDIDGVRSADVRDDDKRGGGLAAIDLARNSVGPSEIAADAVRSREIAGSSITSAEIRGNTIEASDIADGGSVAPSSPRSMSAPRPR